MEVDEKEQEEIQEEDKSLKALSCIDRVRVLNFLLCTDFIKCLTLMLAYYLRTSEIYFF